MTDISRAYQEARSLPDDVLVNEMQNPSGMMPSYIAMSELNDRKALRAGGGGAPKKRTSLAEELAMSVQSSPVRQFSEGGRIGRLNPFHAFLEALQNPELSGAIQQEQINAMHGNQPPLMQPQRPVAASGPVHTSLLRPQPPGTPEPLKRYAGGGIASLMGR
jgi:hypothetical protein